MDDSNPVLVNVPEVVVVDPLCGHTGISSRTRKCATVRRGFEVIGDMGSNGLCAAEMCFQQAYGRSRCNVKAIKMAASSAG
jgi:hypothetical protein